MKKKASIHLSIETVVLIIIAVVFLALSILFVGYIFHNANIDIKDVFSSVTKTKIEQLKLSEKVFDLETYTLDIKPGEKKDIIMLLRNKGNYENYSWEISHTVSNITGDVDCNAIQFNYKSNMSIMPGQDATPPMIIQTLNNINKGTCLFELTAKDSEDYVETLSLTINII